MVGRVGENRHHLLGNLSSVVPLGDGIQLEWTLPFRATLSPRNDLRCHGSLVALGLWLINTNWITSVANLLFIIVLQVIFATAENVMHPPPSPIFSSGNYVIIGFFIALIVLTLVAAYFLSRFFLTLKTEHRRA